MRNATASKPSLTDGESRDIAERVMAILEQHRGAANAITGHDLARAFGQHNDRKIRLVIADLIAAGHPIAASVSDPAGYYLIATRQEAEAYMAVLKSRAQQTFKRMADVGHAVERAFGVPYQPPLLPNVNAYSALAMPIDLAQAMREADDRETW